MNTTHTAPAHRDDEVQPWQGDLRDGPMCCYCGGARVDGCECAPACDGCDAIILDGGVVACRTATCTCTECVENRAADEADRDAKLAQRAADDDQGADDGHGAHDWRTR